METCRDTASSRVIWNGSTRSWISIIGGSKEMAPTRSSRLLNERRTIGCVEHSSRQFQGICRRCGANISVCSAWQGFQLGITAQCWVRPGPPEQRSSRHRTVHLVVKRSTRCYSVFVFCELMMLGAAVRPAFGSISTSSYSRS